MLDDDSQGWDSRMAIRIVKAHSRRTLTLRQLQKWDRSKLVAATGRGTNRQRLYTYRDVRRLCIVAELLNAGLSPQKLVKAMHGVERAAGKVGRPWESLRLVSDGESVLIVDGDIGLDAIRFQIVSLTLLGDLEKRTRAEWQRQAARRTSVAAKVR